MGYVYKRMLVCSECKQEVDPAGICQCEGCKGKICEACCKEEEE